MIRILKNRVEKGIVTEQVAPALSSGIESAGAELKRVIRERFGRSLALREVDTGSCGACESEIIALTNPLYDIQRFGIQFVASPRHADALVVTGPVSKNMRIALEKTYTAMPEPKFVITIGDCALDGGIFKGSYYVDQPVRDIVPVALHIPGCPPSPRVIIEALTAFVRRMP